MNTVNHDPNTQTDILTGQELILLYRVDASSEAGRLFRQIAKDFGADIRELELQDLDESILSIFSETASQIIEAARLEELDSLAINRSKRGYCIFCGFSKAGFEALLKRWHEAKVSHVAQKAVATKHNQEWALHALFTELEREHTVTTAFVALRKDVHRLQQALELRGIDPDTVVEQESHPMKHRLYVLRSAKHLLADISLINEAEEFLTVHRDLKEAWEL